MSVRIPQTRYACLPTGEYPAKIEAITLEQGTFGPQLKWKFALLGEHDGRNLTGWCSGEIFSPKSKAYKWTCAALDVRDLPPDWDFDSDELLGRHVRLTVIVKENGSGEEYNKIDEVRAQQPLRPSMPQKPVPVAAAARVATTSEPPPITDAYFSQLQEAPEPEVIPF